MVKLRTWAGCALLVLALARSALADDKATIDAVTKSAIETVITQQLDALDHDNGPAAEAFATPAIQQKFPKPSAFLAMVKDHYAALLHPKSTSFGEASASPHGPLQTVTIVASDGTVWTAVYSLEQVDGHWRISGCGLQKNEGQQDI